MKRFVLFLFGIFVCTFAYSETLNLEWYVDNQVYQTSTCEIGGNVTPPTPPAKYGYTFQEWLPYIPIEYLESTGTQYINTDIAYKEELAAKPFKMDFTVAFTQFYTNSGLCGGFSGTTGPNNYVRIMFTGLCYDGTNDNFVFSQTTTNQFFTGCFPGLFSPTHIIIEINPLSKYYEISMEKCEINSGSLNNNPTSDNKLFIFKYKSEKGIPIRLYKWTYESNGVKIRDFIPVLDPTGTPCMYDKVEGKFYYNQGTGQFIAGPVIDE